MKTTMLAALGAATMAAVAAATATAASPVQGSISGPITAVSGKTFTVKTTLSPTGSAKVTVGAGTQLSELGEGTAADLTKGTCVMASGTRKGKTVAAQRIGISPGVNGKCGAGFRPRGTRPRTGNGAPPPGNRGRGNGFTPPASFGFAFGSISAVKGSTLTVKSASGSVTVTVSAKTQITKTSKVSASALATKLCAFVRGSSSDKGVTVAATDVTLSKPRNGSCGFTGRRRRPGSR